MDKDSETTSPRNIIRNLVRHTPKSARSTIGVRKRRRESPEKVMQESSVNQTPRTLIHNVLHEAMISRPLLRRQRSPKTLPSQPSNVVKQEEANHKLHKHDDELVNENIAIESFNVSREDEFDNETFENHFLRSEKKFTDEKNVSRRIQNETKEVDDNEINLAMISMQKIDDGIENNVSTRYTLVTKQSDSNKSAEKNFRLDDGDKNEKKIIDDEYEKEVEFSANEMFDVSGQNDESDENASVDEVSEKNESAEKVVFSGVDDNDSSVKNSLDADDGDSDDGEDIQMSLMADDDAEVAGDVDDEDNTRDLSDETNHIDDIQAVNVADKHYLVRDNAKFAPEEKMPLDKSHVELKNTLSVDAETNVFESDKNNFFNGENDENVDSSILFEKEKTPINIGDDDECCHTNITPRAESNSQPRYRGPLVVQKRFHQTTSKNINNMRTCIKTTLRAFLEHTPSSSCIDAVISISNKFLNQAAADLSAYANHANRRRIDRADINCLFVRQRLVNDKRDIAHYVRRYLPREFQAELFAVALASLTNNGV